MHTYGNVTPPGFSRFCEKADGKERYRDAHTNRERKRMSEIEEIGGRGRTNERYTPLVPVTILCIYLHRIRYL